MVKPPSKRKATAARSFNTSRMDQTLKVRLIIQAFNQQLGIIFRSTLSAVTCIGSGPVVRLLTLRNRDVRKSNRGGRYPTEQTKRCTSGSWGHRSTSLRQPGNPDNRGSTFRRAFYESRPDAIQPEPFTRG